MFRTLACAIVMIMLLAACGGDDEDPTATSAAAEPTATTEAAASTGTTENEATATGETEESTATGETEEPTATEGAQATGTSAGQATEGSGEGPIVVTDARGEVELEGPAQRVVVLEWTYAEDLVAVGVQPAGVADIEGYNSWVNVEPPLADDVTDVGTRQEPSLESIAALEPDLIIGVLFRHEPIYAELSEIAPTLLFNPYPEDQAVTQFDEMETTFTEIAKAVGKESEGQAVLEDMYAYFDEAAATLEEAGQAGSEFLLVQAFAAGAEPTMRIFTDNAMATEILVQIGLVNGWDGAWELYGFTTVDNLEPLTTVSPDINFFYVVQDDDNVFENEWADNPVWTSLPFVQDGRTYPLGGDTWTFGGPLSAELIADKVVAALTQ